VHVKFRVIQPGAKHPDVVVPTFVLEQDKWNDYSFQTQYHLSCRRVAGEVYENLLIGTVKILRREQTEEDGILVNGDFESLPNNFCSVGESLDYYERLSLLGRELRVAVLKALNDVVQDPSIRSEFSKERGWSASLFRFAREGEEEYLSIASSLLTGDYTEMPTDDLSFSFQLPGWEVPITFAFSGDPSNNLLQQDENSIAARISTLVGANGSGKSTFIARLARVAFGSVDDRRGAFLSGVGAIEPEGIGFPRILAVSFSPFDTFRLPGSDGRNRKQILQDMQKGQGRFVFIGLRDLLSESDQEAASDALSSLTSDDDRLDTNRLKSIEQLADELVRGVELATQKGRLDFLAQVSSELRSSSVLFAILALLPIDIASARDAFMASSTGHKIAALIVVGLIGNIERRSLVLIDEPETHLHPPLLATLMHTIRQTLAKYRAFAIVGTHSPVVVQESLGRLVRIMRREGSQTDVRLPKSETFGENIGTISAEVFGLQSSATDFHALLDKLVRESSDIESIERLFLDSSMSMQARAYVLAELSKQNS
jgi:hypothetical protein